HHSGVAEYGETNSGRRAMTPAAETDASAWRVDGAVAVLLNVRSGITRWGYCARPQQTRMHITWPTAAARAQRKRRDHKAASAPIAQTLVTATRRGAHQLVSRAKICGAPSRARTNVSAAAGANSTPETRARVRKP